MIVKVRNSSINLQEYPLSLIDRGQRRLSFRDSITTYISFGHSFSKIAFGLFLLLFCLDYNKKRKTKSRIAGQQLTTRAWQTLPWFLFLRDCLVSPNLKDALLFCWVVQCKSTTKSMKMCLEIIKLEKKNRMEVHIYAHDQCQANLCMGWLVCACITIFHEVITIFLAVICRSNTFWSMYPRTVCCTQMLTIAIHCTEIHRIEGRLWCKQTFCMVQLRTTTL